MNRVPEQETFDHVARHLFAQGRPAMESLACVYRTTFAGRTLCCAVGCLIPAEDYHSYFEGMPVHRILPDVPALESHNERLLARLQDAHDKWATSGRTIENGVTPAVADDYLRDCLEVVARTFNLSIAVLNDLRLVSA